MPSFVRSGSSFVANSQTQYGQSRSSITALSDGGFVVVWQTDVNQEVKSQRYNAQGIAVGAETLVNNLSSGSQTMPRVASLANGGYVVTWETSDTTQDGSGTAIKARLFDSAGAAVGGEFRVNSQASLDQKGASVTGLADGGFVVAWYTTDSSQDGSGWSIKAQRYDSAGAAVGAEFRVNTVAFGSQYNIDIASLSSGGFVVTWQTGNSSGTQVSAQIYGADGTKSGAEITVSNGFSSHTEGRVAGLANGGFVVTWMTNTGEQLGIMAQVFDSAGTKVGSAFVVNPNTGGLYPDVAAAADGSFLITWEGRYGGIKSQSYSATGQRLGSEYTVVGEMNGTSSGVSVAALSNGKYVIGLTHNGGTASGDDIRLQMMAPNTAPELGAETRAVSVAENLTGVATVAATDPDGPSTLTYSIVGGADAARFTINASTGFLSFVSAPNFEAPTDSDGNNVYLVTVRASDGDLTDVQTLSVTVTNQNEAPVITSNGAGASAAISVLENGLAVTTVTAADPEGAAITYSISGGADASKFLIDGATGALSFLTSPDFEQPGDSDGNNVYLVTVRASDGVFVDTQALSITVGNVNERPVFAGGTSIFRQVDEGQTAVTNVAASDPDGPTPLTYSIGGGAHAALFAIDSATGALSFVAAPDYEAPAQGSGNFYSVVVTASDGSLSSSQTVQVAVGNVNEGVAITSGSSASVGENGTAVMTVAAEDMDGDAVSFTISGGADAALFTIDSATGALSFVAAPNFEAPGDSDGDNVYQVQVSASDGSLSDTRSISVTVTDEAEAIAFVSGGGGDQASVAIAENSGNLLALQAVDPDGATPLYGIAGGADAALFEIDSFTKTLRFKALPDFEAPLDADGDNVYEVVVGTTDGQSFDYQTVLVTVGNVYEGVSFGPPGVEFAVDENQGQIGAVAASSGDRRPLTYTISGGPDSALFSLDPATGILSFKGAPDYEAPGDSGGHNVYRITVSASDGTSSAIQSVIVVVGNVDEGIELLSYGGDETVSLSLEENMAAAGQVEARDLDGGAVTYSIAGGADAALFAVDAATGALSFLDAPDFEAPGDSGGDNVYDVVVAASGGGSTATQAFAVSVTNRNEGIFISSDGGGTSAFFSVNEGERAVTTVVASDPDGSSATYSIIGGADASRFTIDASTGVLTLNQAPDYEAPIDAYEDNFYSVIVSASDGEASAWQLIQVTVNNVNEGVTITSPAAVSLDENQPFVTTVAATDGDGDPITYSIVGGADSAHFVIDPETGALTAVTSLDFEAPVDSDGDNVYEVTVRASDGRFSDDRQMSITVNDLDDDVEIVSYGGADLVSLTVQEGEFTVADVDSNMSSFFGVTFSIGGGADAALFEVDGSTGVLRFKYPFAPDFEAPADSGGDNVYDVVVVANRLTTSDSQAFAITVANRNEGLWITSDGGGDSALFVDEGNRNVTTVVAFDPDGDVPTYSIAGGADAARFAIDPVTGVLTFIEAPNFEMPADAGGNNVYNLIVAASDGGYTDTQVLTITVGNVNEAPVITSGGGAATLAVTVNENGFAVTGIAASDVDGNPLTYSIAGGADASRFTIDSSSGILRFIEAPDFEAPGDVGGNNVYDVIVSVTDGLLSDTQALSVTVANLAEIVTIISNGGGSSASIAVAENGTAVTTVAASNPDGGGSVTYAIAGGADAARFTINASTGALAFLAAPNFEAPADSGADNVYDVVVSAGNGTTTDTQALAVTVGNVDEQMTIVSNGGGASAAVAMDENTTLVTTVVGLDPDGGPVTYAILAGGDSSLFTIDSTTGVLSFRVAPDFEAPGDSGGDNVYNLVVMASDGHWSYTQAIAVTVRNVNEAPVITSGGGGASAAVSVVENGLVVAIVAATDAEGGAPVYSIAGGADATRFTINAQTGLLQFVAAPDWELPGDSNGDNVYSVIVRASDGSLVDDQVLNVTVTNVRDGNNVTGTSGGDSISVTSASLALRTSNAEDLVFGRDGNDTIHGMAGDDELYGEGGNDVLVGGAGADKLLGGLGKDQFVYNAVSDSTAASRDLIMDFSRSQGDKISLSAIDANSLVSSDQAFTFIGTAAFSNVAGQLRYETSGGITTISGDVNGDGIADLQIQLSGSIALIASDFIL